MDPTPAQPPSCRRIALFDAFPRLRFSAEREFIQRSIIALARLGVEAARVTTSDEVAAFDPDLVIVTHEFVPKLTDHPTIGVLWSPAAFYKNDEFRIAAIRSWDVVIAASDETYQFARDVQFTNGRENNVLRFDFFPSTHVVDAAPEPDPALPPLAYIGVHWDGDRHGPLLRALAERGTLGLYGPAAAWEDYGPAYLGAVPFDGVSVPRTLARHRAVLAIHKGEHRRAGLPSMRVFEAAATGTPVIGDRIPVLHDMFGAGCVFVDLDDDVPALVERIEDVCRELAAAPAAAAAKDRAALKASFDRVASLEVLYAGLLAAVAERRATRPGLPAPGATAPLTMIVRVGGRPIDFVRRAVASLRRQSLRPSDILFVRFDAVSGLDELVDELRAEGVIAARVIDVAKDGVRSRATWAGLAAVRTDFFALLDDDDELFSNHVEELMRVFRADPDARFVYGGTVRHEEGENCYVYENRFRGDLAGVVLERRQLHFSDQFSLARLLRFDNYIQSNAWMARRDLLTPELLVDPDLRVAEDLYFYLLVCARTVPRFTGSATAIWNWRSDTAGNSMMSEEQDVWHRSGERVLRRLRYVRFPVTTTLDGEHPFEFPWRRAGGGAAASSTRRALSVDGGPFSPADVEGALGAHGFASRESAGIWGVMEAYGFAVHVSAAVAAAVRAAEGDFVVRLFGFAIEPLHAGELSATLGEHPCRLVRVGSDRVDFLFDRSAVVAGVALFSVAQPGYVSPLERGTSNDARHLRFLIETCVFDVVQGPYDDLFTVLSCTHTVDGASRRRRYETRYEDRPTEVTLTTSGAGTTLTLAASAGTFQLDELVVDGLTLVVEPDGDRVRYAFPHAAALLARSGGGTLIDGLMLSLREFQRSDPDEPDPALRPTSRGRSPPWVHR